MIIDSGYRYWRLRLPMMPVETSPNETGLRRFHCGVGIQLTALIDALLMKPTLNLQGPMNRLL